MRGFFDFLCDDGHLNEHFVHVAIRELDCKDCGKDSVRIISSPQIKLEGITGSFPGAADKWVKKRAEKLQQERKQAESRGDT